MKKFQDSVRAMWKRSRGLGASKGGRRSKRLTLEHLEDRRMFCNVTVNSTADTVNWGDGLLTLREAILLHNQPSKYLSKLNKDLAATQLDDPGSLGKGLDTIHLENLQGAVFQLNTWLDPLVGQITIQGAGPSKTTVLRKQGASSFRIFTVDSNAIVTFSGLKISGGNAFEAAPWTHIASNVGGGIYSRGKLTTITNCLITDCGAYESGGGVYNAQKSRMVLNSTTIQNCAANGGGGAFNCYGTMELHNSTIRKCLAEAWGAPSPYSQAGGAIYNMCSTLTIDQHSLISANRGIMGGGIMNVGCYDKTGTVLTRATLNIRDSRLENNRAMYSPYDGQQPAAERGGAIYNQLADLAIHNSSLSGNSAAWQGGGVYNESGSLAAWNSTFSGNSATRAHGGAIYATKAWSPLRLQNSCQFTGNSAGTSGGAIYGTGAFGLRIDTGAAYFYQNTAALDGGAICCDTSAVISGATFGANTAGREGGAIYVAEKGRLDADDCTFGVPPDHFVATYVSYEGGNTALRGGAISNHVRDVPSRTTMDNCTFQYNTATYSGATSGGGAIYNQGNLAIYGCVLRINVAMKGSGGAIYNAAAYAHQETYASDPNRGLSVAASTFEGNAALANGGGICNAAWFATVKNSTFASCSASGFGGGLYNESGAKLSGTNDTYWANSAKSGGGIFSRGDLTLLFNTIANNRAQQRGVGGLIQSPLASTPGHVRATNTLISQNYFTDASGAKKRSDLWTPGIDFYFGDFFDHCLVLYGQGTGLVNGEAGNIVGKDPKLADLADNGGLTKTCKLLAGSPAIGAASPISGTIDQRGLPRKSRPDIGAYET